MGERAAPPQDRPREQAEGQRPEGHEAGTDAHDADVPATAGKEASRWRSTQSQLSKREASAGSDGPSRKVGGNGVGTVPKNWGNIFIEISAEGLPSKWQ